MAQKQVEIYCSPLCQKDYAVTKTEERDSLIETLRGQHWPTHIILEEFNISRQRLQQIISSRKVPA